MTGTVMRFRSLKEPTAQCQKQASARKLAEAPRRRADAQTQQMHPVKKLKDKGSVRGLIKSGPGRQLERVQCLVSRGYHMFVTGRLLQSEKRLTLEQEMCNALARFTTMINPQLKQILIKVLQRESFPRCTRLGEAQLNMSVSVWGQCHSQTIQVFHVCICCEL